MESSTATEALATLGHPGRLAVFRLLARRAPDGVPAGEIAAALGLKPNTLSVHVAALSRAGLVHATRMGRTIRYGIDLQEVGALIDFLITDCCRGRPELCAPLASHTLERRNRKDGSMQDTRFNVLFICTGNSARSDFAETLLRALGSTKFRAFSAGTKPYSELNAEAIKLLTHRGHDISALRAKNVAEFQGPDAPQMDFVFTVCDRAANEECPPWPGQPITAHWGIPDPVKVVGTAAERGLAFQEAYRTLRHRLMGFVALPVATLDRISLQGKLDALGQEHAVDGVLS